MEREQLRAALHPIAILRSRACDVVAIASDRATGVAATRTSLRSRLATVRVFCLSALPGEGEPVPASDRAPVRGQE
jgi:hypothetical protein